MYRTSELRKWQAKNTGRMGICSRLLLLHGCGLAHSLLLSCRWWWPRGTWGGPAGSATTAVRAAGESSVFLGSCRRRPGSASWTWSLGPSQPSPYHPVWPLDDSAAARVLSSLGWRRWRVAPLTEERSGSPPLMVRKQVATTDFEGEEASRRYNLHWITGTAALVIHHRKGITSGAAYGRETRFLQLRRR